MSEHPDAGPTSSGRQPGSAEPSSAEPDSAEPGTSSTDSTERTFGGGAGPDGEPEDTDGAPGEQQLAAGAARPRLRWSRVGMLLAGALVLAGAFILTLPSPYLRLSPGPTPQLVGTITGQVANPDLCTPGAPGCRHGRLMFTTVRADPISWWQLQWYRTVDRSVQVVPSAGAGAAVTQAELDQMTEAKQAAASVAWRLVHGTELGHTTGALVGALTPAGPAERAGVQVGDRITAAGPAGHLAPIASAEDLAAAAKSAAATASPLTLAVTRAGTQTQITVPLRTGAKLGVLVTTPLTGTPHLDVPTGAIGGPSAGLMFTLAFVDALSPGDLTGGASVAGTGTIDLNGTVGPIGGITDKVAGAAAAGARVFLAPDSQAAQAADAAPAGLTVVPVHTAADAVTWLCQHGATSSVCEHPGSTPSH